MVEVEASLPPHGRALELVQQGKGLLDVAELVAEGVRWVAARRRRMVWRRAARGVRSSASGLAPGRGQAFSRGGRLQVGVALLLWLGEGGALDSAEGGASMQAVTGRCQGVHSRTLELLEADN